VLFLLFGSSGSGKTTLLEAVRGVVERLALHDFDEIGVPEDATTAWRHEANERWLQRVLAYQADDVDTLLAGQTPLAEILAAPSAHRLAGLAACLLDCDDAARTERLMRRDRIWGTLEDMLAWAAWMRGHAADPTQRLDVLGLTADRLAAWDGTVRVLDTTGVPVERSADELLDWIEAERDAAIPITVTKS
jgi:energy-coupling factor transporter ATP-binding protein EcfA2